MFRDIHWRLVFLLAISPIGILTIELLSEYAGRIYGADEADVGWLAGGEAGMAAVVSLLLYLFPKLRFARLITFATVVLWSASVLCLFITEFYQLILLCLVMGAAAGCICSRSYQLLTVAPSPSRQLGAMIALQAVVLSLTFIAVSYLSEWFTNALFLVSAIWLTVCLICCVSLNEKVREEIRYRKGVGNKARIWFFLLVGLSYACHGAYNTFIVEFASQQGISLVASGWVMTAGCAVGLITGIWSVAEDIDKGSKPSYIKPLAVSVCSLCVATLLLLNNDINLMVYTVSVVLYNFGWCLAVPYQVALAAKLNDGGRTSSMLLFLQALGMALGAVVLGQLAFAYGIAMALTIFIPVASLLALYSAYRIETQVSTYTGSDKLTFETEDC